MSLIFLFLPSLFVQDSIPYDLTKPTHTISLTDPDLLEISGLSPVDSAGLMPAINDERGEAMFVDAKRGGAVKRRAHFRDKGDFEGVELLGKCLYAIRSDGVLFEMMGWKDGRPKVWDYDTGLTKEDDVEGLGYDPERRALLLACKGDPESDAPRLIYAFDLETKQLQRPAVYRIDPKEINRLTPYDDQDKQHFFSPSGVAVHPKTKDIYVISTALKRLAVLDRKSGAVKYAVRLDKKLLPQPEGIAFDALGNLYIGSEGKKGETGLLYRFDLKKNPEHLGSN
jgi:uncharacterized protein YjiK